MALGLPSTTVPIVAAGFTFARARFEREVPVWRLTFLAAPLTYPGIMIFAGWRSPS